MSHSALLVHGLQTNPPTPNVTQRGSTLIHTQDWVRNIQVLIECYQLFFFKKWLQQRKSALVAFKLEWDDCVLQAKESWELEGSEKLEQSEVLKAKGTSFFKVRSPFWSQFMWLFIRCGVLFFLLTTFFLYRLHNCLTGREIQNSSWPIQTSRRFPQRRNWHERRRGWKTQGAACGSSSQCGYVRIEDQRSLRDEKTLWRGFRVVSRQREGIVQKGTGWLTYNFVVLILCCSAARGWKTRASRKRVVLWSPSLRETPTRVSFIFIIFFCKIFCRLAWRCKNTRKRLPTSKLFFRLSLRTKQPKTNWCFVSKNWKRSKKRRRKDMRECSRNLQTWMQK